MFPVGDTNAVRHHCRVLHMLGSSACPQYGKLYRPVNLFITGFALSSANCCSSCFQVYLFSHELVYKYVGSTGVALVQLLAYVSSCCNPITYCFMNKKFRQAFLAIFDCYRCLRYVLVDSKVLRVWIVQVYRFCCGAVTMSDMLKANVSWWILIK